MMDQPELDVGDGPIGLILAPTRELVVQIHSEAKRFMKPYHINVGAFHSNFRDKCTSSLLHMRNRISLISLPVYSFLSFACTGGPFCCRSVCICVSVCL